MSNCITDISKIITKDKLSMSNTMQNRRNIKNLLSHDLP